MSTSRRAFHLAVLTRARALADVACRRAAEVVGGSDTFHSKITTPMPAGAHGPRGADDRRGSSSTTWIPGTDDRSAVARRHGALAAAACGERVDRRTRRQRLVVSGDGCSSTSDSSMLLTPQWWKSTRGSARPRLAQAYHELDYTCIAAPARCRPSCTRIPCGYRLAVAGATIRAIVPELIFVWDRWRRALWDVGTRSWGIESFLSQRQTRCYSPTTCRDHGDARQAGYGWKSGTAPRIIPGRAPGR